MFGLTKTGAFLYLLGLVGMCAGVGFTISQVFTLAMYGSEPFWPVATTVHYIIAGATAIVIGLGLVALSIAKLHKD
jgi:hypothetical protein